jgi:hypothetical protein
MTYTKNFKPKTQEVKMLKPIAHFEAIVNGKTGHWILDHDTPVEVAKEMLFQFQKDLGQIEDNIKALQDKQKREEEQKASKLEPIPTENNSEVVNV